MIMSKPTTLQIKRKKHCLPFASSYSNILPLTSNSSNQKTLSVIWGQEGAFVAHGDSDVCLHINDSIGQ